MLVEVEVVGVGGGDTTPGESIVPAKAETARTTVTIAIAHVRRNLFTILYLQGYSLFCDYSQDTKLFALNLSRTCKHERNALKLVRC